MLKSVKEYTPSFVVRSVASQLSAEMKRHYKYGTKTLSKKVEKMIEKGQFAGRSSGGSHLERPSYSPFCACECRRRQDCRARRDPRPYQHPSRGGFDPRSYHEKGYFLRGSIKTDGYQLQLLAYKVRELNSVKYKRYHTDLLPDRLLTTTASTGDHLIEVRNVFKSKADVKRLLGCTDDDTDQVSYLDIDLSQAFVVGTYSSIPQDKNPKIGKRRCHRQKKKRGSRGRRNRGSGNCRKKSVCREGRQWHINLAAKQKAVAQPPTLKHRSWISLFPLHRHARSATWLSVCTSITHQKNVPGACSLLPRPRASGVSTVPIARRACTAMSWQDTIL
ncbi:hypothetical protein EDD21DRAFT_384692 [Dissophora ornata]|nr:hypothetical protein EDD21DRAFT_384692 [Dissophora ornata]